MLEMKKIVLVEPPTGEKELTSFKYPPIGLIALAAYLNKNGYEVTLINAAIDNLSVDDIIKRIKNSQAGFIGLSSMSVHISQTFKIAKELKNNDPQIKIIAGGIHPTIMPEHTLSTGNIDAVVIGEGELTALELLEA